MMRRRREGRREKGGWQRHLKVGCQNDPRDVERRHNHSIVKNQVGLMEAKPIYRVIEARYCVTRGIESCLEIAR